MQPVFNSFTRMFYFMDAQEIISNIDKIYADYFIPKNLQMHMRLVAGVAQKICENSKEKVDEEKIIAVALIHDLGNIVKMKFEGETAKFLLQEDFQKIDFYKAKKEEFAKKYGANDKTANYAMAKELGVEDGLLKLIDLPSAIKIKGEKYSTTNNFTKLVLLYSDMRVSPSGVVSMNERLGEFAKRYSIKDYPEKLNHSKVFCKAAQEIEKKVFEKVNLRPEDINKETVKAFF